MAVDSTVGGLPNLPDIADDALLVVEFQGEAYHLTGAQWKAYAIQSVKNVATDTEKYAVAAKGASDEAKRAAEDANAAAAGIGTAVQDAQAAARGAAASQYAANTARNDAEQAKAAAEQAAASVADDAAAAQQANTEAQKAKSETESARADAEKSAANAKTDRQAAEQAKQDAVAAQEAADASKAAAAQSANTAVQYSGKPPRPQNGTWWVWNAETGQYEDTGIKSILSIVKSYGSVAEMDADLLNMSEGDLVIIAAAVNFEENSQLYVHTGTNWRYLSDLSGIQGVGISNIVLTKGNHTPGTFDVYTIYLTDGREFLLSIYNGADGKGSGDMLADIYDPTGKRTDIFAYVDDVVGDIGTILDAINGEAV